jgi:hypothetical protein
VYAVRWWNKPLVKLRNFTQVTKNYKFPLETTILLYLIMYTTCFGHILTVVSNNIHYLTPRWACGNICCNLRDFTNFTNGMIFVMAHASHRRVNESVTHCSWLICLVYLHMQARSLYFDYFKPYNVFFWRLIFCWTVWVAGFIMYVVRLIIISIQ